MLLFNMGSFLGEEGVGWGGGVIFFHPGANLVNSFSWGLGTKSNNEFEWLSLYHNLKLIDGKTMPYLMAFDDFRQII